MKVSTDACIQGAWAAKLWRSEALMDILDIGTGTGLLSLMLAQKLSDATISAIEIESAAQEQAQENFELSVWNNRMKVTQCSLQEFEPSKTFDAIICNPPFFHKHLNSAAQQRNLARHDEQLSKEALASNVARLLRADGLFCVLYPASEWSAWLTVAELNGLYLSHEIAIMPYANKSVNRMVGFFKKQQSDSNQQTQFTIYEDAGKNYTKAFVELMQDYYLHL